MSQAEISTVCRCCLHGSTKTISIFSRHKSSTYANMIRDCCSLEVTTVDEMSSHICLRCSSKLRSFYKFRKMCLKINNILLKNLQSLNSMHSEDIDESKEITDESENQPLKISNSYGNYVISDDIKIESDEEEPFIRDDCCFTNMEIQDDIIGSIHSENSVKDKGFLLQLTKETSGFPPNVLQCDENSNIEKDDFESKPIDVLTVKAKEPRKNTCLLCKKDCKNSQRLADHMNWVHKGIKYFCELCKKSYTSRQGHIRNAHSTGRQCAICGLMCENQTKYYTHIQNKHRKGDPQRCSECGTVCSSNASLARHRSAVHGEAKFICQYCSRTFKRKDKLNDHIKTHTKEKPFACDVCPYRFPTKHLLTRHRRRHTATRSIKCDYCESMFRTKEDLRQHITRHDASFKPYACTVCGKRFRRSDHRNTHQTNVHKVEVSHDRIKM